MSCLLAEILPSSDNTVDTLTDVTSDTETVFRLRNSDVATIAVPSSFDADGKPFRLIIAGKKHATSTSTTGQMRLVLGDEDNLEGSNITIDVFASMSGSLESQFLYVADCLWSSSSQKLVLAVTKIIGTSVTRTDNNLSSISSQSDLNFSLFGKFTSTGFDSSDSLTITVFKIEEI